MNEKEYEVYEARERREDKAASYDKPILDGQWQKLKENVNEVFYEVGSDWENEEFLDAIWDVSVNELPELEVSVIVDSHLNLFISKGTGSFVDYESENVTGMRLPLLCWIHTHPFGKAYFSGTDWNTIRTQKPILESAIVLGNMERMKWWTQQGKEMLCKTEKICLNEEEE
jgi:hypothetical protein